MPAKLRSSVFALDRCIAGVLGAMLAPLVGILAERCFGYDTAQHRHHGGPPTTPAGVAASHQRATVVAAQNLNNAHALERGLLLVLVIPMGVKFLVRPAPGCHAHGVRPSACVLSLAAMGMARVPAKGTDSMRRARCLPICTAPPFAVKQLAASSGVECRRQAQISSCHEKGMGQCAMRQRMT